jgi:hypothetical protein
MKKVRKKRKKSLIVMTMTIYTRMGRRIISRESRRRSIKCRRG